MTISNQNNATRLFDVGSELRKSSIDKGLLVVRQLAKRLDADNALGLRAA